MLPYISTRGGYRVFQKGGLRPAIRNAGGGGGVGWGGSAVRFNSCPLLFNDRAGGGGCEMLQIIT